MLKDKVVQRVINKYKQRSRKGLETYGQGLDENFEDDFLIHLQEELMDAVNYIEKLLYDRGKDCSINERSGVPK